MPALPRLTRSQLAWMAVWLGLTVVYFATPGVFGHKLSGDAWWYYAQVRSLVVEGDLDLRTEAAQLPWRKKINANTGHIENPYQLGTPLLWLPFFLLALAVAWVRFRLFASPLPTAPPLGFDPFTPELTAYGTVVWVTLGLWLCHRMLRPRVGARLSALSLAVLFCGSNLVLFTLWHPGYSHGCAMFAVAWLCGYWEHTRGRCDVRRWAGLGALVGLATLVRAQHVLFALVPATELALLALPLLKARAWRPVGSLALCVLTATAAALAVFSPQMLAWHYLYGSVITIPQGSGYMVFGRFGLQPLLGALFWSKNGLLPWHPLLFLALLGLVLALRRERALTATLLVGFVAQLWLNTSNIDIEGGWSFGQRKFTDCFFILVFGFAVALQVLLATLTRHKDALPRLVLALPLALAIAINGALIWRIGTKEQLVARSFDMRDVYLGATRTLLDGVWTVMGNPAAFPAPWIFALLYDVPPERFDRLVGNHLLYQRPDDPGMSQNRFVLDLTTPLGRDLVRRHGGFVGSGKDSALRSAKGAIDFVLPMWFQNEPVVIVALAHSAAAPTAPAPGLALWWNGDLVPWEPVPSNDLRRQARLTPDQVRWGINRMRLVSESEVGAEFVLQSLALQVRPAPALE